MSAVKPAAAPAAAPPGEAAPTKGARSEHRVSCGNRALPALLLLGDNLFWHKPRAFRMCPYLPGHTQLSRAVTDGKILYMREPLMSGVEEEPGPIWHRSFLGKSLFLSSAD